MSLPFYVNPEQMARDKSEYARKGIARGKSVVTLECGAGVLMVAENPLKLQKLGEIYDRIAFAGVGRFSEFERLRKMGVQWADVEGYRFSRDDVRGKALANLYAQALGEEFTRSSKPFEVEIVVAEVGDAELAGQEANAIYQVSFDGAIQDHEGYCVIGGSIHALQRHLETNYRANLELGAALRLGRDTLQRAENGNPNLRSGDLEVIVLDRRRSGRRFRRLPPEEVQQILG
ncbi:MAG: proteasome subunit alpha [Deltaproteobacteria bacterium]|nr:proteasome subunit alpha [Deltaproteobacteria bacterium]